MNANTKDHYPFISACLSILIHLSLLLIGGNILLEKARYHVQPGSVATEVELVSALPTPLEAPEPVQKPDEPQAKEPEPLPKEPVKKPTPPPKKVQPSVKSSRPQATRTKKAPSSSRRKSRTLPSRQGARVSAKPDYLRNPPPRYPEFARRARKEGTVVLRVVVSKSGIPLSVVIRRSSGVQSLDNAALKAVKNWRFKPGTLGGLPIKSTVEVPVRFQLNQ